MAHLYPKVVVKGKSFVDVKRVTVPNQSMSLREIVRRFVRRESLPVYNEGVYESRFGDLEKIKNLDITEQLEIAEDLKAKIAAYEQRLKDDAAKAKQEAEDVAKFKADKAEKDKQPEGQSMAKSAPPARGPAEGQSKSNQ